MARTAALQALDTSRRRLTRQAQRLEKQAASASGGLAKSLRSQANDLRSQAKSLTAKNMRSGEGVTDFIQRVKAETEYAKVSYQRGISETREIAAEAKISGQFKHDFFAGTASLWQGKKGDRMENIVAAFNENAWKIDDATKQAFEQRFGYALYFPLDAYDVMNLTELNMGGLPDSEKRPGTPTIEAQAIDAYVSELIG